MMQLRVDILTIDCANPRRRIPSKNIDWNDSSDRKWLMNHLHWAMNNRHSVTLCEGKLAPARESN